MRHQVAFSLLEGTRLEAFLLAFQEARQQSSECLGSPCSGRRLLASWVAAKSNLGEQVLCRVPCLARIER